LGNEIALVLITPLPPRISRARGAKSARAAVPRLAFFRFAVRLAMVIPFPTAP
jgi:hypothetical protein